ncbi:hypothetical protein KZX46_21155 (plasmid) [Polymorphobacter sp. PAMC 29334]|uniref:hypothetical protein n=1 Tax=Polymorphobacter sp. PAMC 29334 TaxID=2862331 RepID=UPI001C78E8E3|nr:hypothetical protein [Polymorphobacter sp. PAMC 29334]QYE37024.1 hypothetical protein KZX46_21155 [Polymorphobacter sp. PAMC 29334]
MTGKMLNATANLDAQNRHLDDQLRRIAAKLDRLRWQLGFLTILIATVTVFNLAHVFAPIIARHMSLS